jgi:hypothetical protein
MSESISTYVLFGLIAAFWGFLFFAPLISNSTGALVKRAKAEGRYRIVEIDGRQYHGITKTEVIVASPKGRSRAVLIASSRDRDPDMIDGKVVMVPRRLKIRSITKNGLSERERWVPAKGWTVLGNEGIEYHLPMS